MIYQLPNGKCVNISVEEYLNLTHEDIQFLMAGDYGDHIVNPFKSSAIDLKSKPTKDDDFGEEFTEDDFILPDDPFDS